MMPCMLDLHTKFAAGRAAYAAGIPPRQFRHLVMAGFDLPGRAPRQWRQYSAASVVVLAVAGRLSAYLDVRAALAVAIEAIEPTLNPCPAYTLTAPFILRALAGWTLEVVATRDGPVVRVNSADPSPDAIRLDIERIATDTIARLTAPVPALTIPHTKELNR